MNNTTVDHSPCSNGVSTTFTVVLSIISLAAFIGNVLVTATFLKTPNLRTSTNYFIVNMAVSDLVYAFFNWLLFATEGMLNGRSLILEPSATPICKLGLYIRAVSQAVSVLSMVLIAVERFIAIVFPLKATMLSGRIRALLLLLSWLIPLAFGSAYIQYIKIVAEDKQTFCRFAWSGFGQTILYVIGFVIFYIVPLIVIIILYTLIMRSLRGKPNDFIQGHADARRQKQNKNVMKILISIVSAFFICWTPLCIYLALKVSYPSIFVQDKCLLIVGLFFYIFPSLSIAINPVILFTFSTNYRKAAKNLCSQFCSLCKCSPRCTLGNASPQSLQEEDMNQMATVEDPDKRPAQVT